MESAVSCFANYLKHFIDYQFEKLIDLRKVGDRLSTSIEINSFLDPHAF